MFVLPAHCFNTVRNLFPSKGLWDFVDLSLVKPHMYIYSKSTWTFETCNCWDFAKSIKENRCRKKKGMWYPLIKQGDQISLNSPLGNQSITDLCDLLLLFKRWCILLKMCIELKQYWNFAPFVVLTWCLIQQCLYFYELVNTDCGCLHSMGTHPSTNTNTSLLSFFLCKGDFLEMYLSLFGGGPLGVLDLDVPSGCVNSVKASGAHEGYFLSIAEDSEHR